MTEEKTKKGKSLAITGMILGIVALLLWWSLWFGFACAIIGLTLSIIGLVQVNKTKDEGKGMAITGIVTSGIGLLISGILLAIVTFAVGLAGIKMTVNNSNELTRTLNSSIEEVINNLDANSPANMGEITE